MDKHMLLDIMFVVTDDELKVRFSMDEFLLDYIKDHGIHTITPIVKVLAKIENLVDATYEEFKLNEAYTKPMQDDYDYLVTEMDKSVEASKK